MLKCYFTAQKIASKLANDAIATIVDNLVEISTKFAIRSGMQNLSPKAVNITVGATINMSSRDATTMHNDRIVLLCWR